MLSVGRGERTLGQPTKHAHTHTHKLKPLNHFTVVLQPLSPLRFNTLTFVQDVRYSFRVSLCTLELLCDPAVSTTAAVEDTKSHMLAEGVRVKHSMLRAALVRPSCKPASREKPQSTEAADDIPLTAGVDAWACRSDESVRAARVHGAASGRIRDDPFMSRHIVRLGFVHEMTHCPHAASSRIFAHDVRGFFLLSYVLMRQVTRSAVWYSNIFDVRKTKR